LQEVECKCVQTSNNESIVGWLAAKDIPHRVGDYLDSLRICSKIIYSQESSENEVITKTVAECDNNVGAG
jgi:hypothetical protein